LHVDALIALCTTFAVFLVSHEVSALISSGDLSSEGLYRLVFAANQYIASLVVGDAPNSPRHLDGLFTFAVIPHPDRAVITSSHYLP
jgi:hypothetical protein